MLPKIGDWIKNPTPPDQEDGVHSRTIVKVGKKNVRLLSFDLPERMLNIPLAALVFSSSLGSITVWEILKDGRPNF